MWLKWLPWRLLVSRLARSHGFIDPLVLLASLQRFAQPSEVSEPVELLRAGVVFHARGLLNTKAIQHNLDWVWPYWVERQFNPHDPSFIPRGFSITHTNLTHRNWTAVGLPDCDQYGLVDPRGLVTPHFDGWSLDSWLLADQAGPHLLPSRAAAARQQLALDGSLLVRTQIRQGQARLDQSVEMVSEEGIPSLRLRVCGENSAGGWLVLGLRPVNPEGVSFIHRIEVENGGKEWLVNNKERFLLPTAPERVIMSRYAEGDVLEKLPEGPTAAKISCPVGMATAAALYRLEPAAPLQIQALVKMGRGRKGKRGRSRKSRIFPAWSDALQNACRLRVPDRTIQALYEGALHSLVLHSPGEVYPGPYTYKRFWFRDAAFILKGLLLANLPARVERCLARFPDRQRVTGYFHSQNGEWDSNGEALWILEQFSRYTGHHLSARLLESVDKGARWICRKRLDADLAAPHAGLMPAGFSAEHFGPNDFYYWDNFWSAAGLQAAARLLSTDSQKAAAWEQEAAGLLAAVDRSLEQTAFRRKLPGVPASPYRRLDAAAVGCLAASYPLQLWSPGEQRLLDTASFLYENCLVHGGFFQDMIHAGINAYLTLHLSQVFLRAGDQRFRPLLERTAALASPTGQWPEAIHPLTGGGCMGDGQHIWAAAEWVIMLRHCFVREEGARLILGSGILPDWLAEGAALGLGPTPTPWGNVTVEFTVREKKVLVSWQADWRHPPTAVEIRLPGWPAFIAGAEESQAVLSELTKG